MGVGDGDPVVGQGEVAPGGTVTVSICYWPPEIGAVHVLCRSVRRAGALRGL